MVIMPEEVMYYVAEVGGGYIEAWAPYFDPKYIHLGLVFLISPQKVRFYFYYYHNNNMKGLFEK